MSSMYPCRLGCQMHSTRQIHVAFDSHRISPLPTPHPPKTSSNVDEIGAPKGNLGNVCCCFGFENSNLAVETVFTSLARLLRDAVILL